MVATTTSVILLCLLVGTDSLPAGLANVVATAAGMVPSFELNRRWVWGRTGRRSVSEIVPFAILSLGALALSTLAVSAAAAWADRAGLAGGERTLVAVGANLSTFGSLWVLQFFVLDRLLFRPPAAA
jgi:putative flippase GtrA